MSKPKNPVGARVVTARTRAKLSRRQLADLTGITTFRIYRIEKGHGRGILASELIRLAVALGTTAEVLMGTPARAEARG